MSRWTKWLQIAWLKAGIGLKKHPKTALLMGSFLAMWLMLWIGLAWWIEDIPRMRPWIETLNGATWSDEWKRQWCEHPIWFAGSLATRITINFAPPFSVLVALIWFLLGGLERYMHMTQLELFKLLNAELVPTLVAVLKKRDHLISAEDQAVMQKAADDLAQAFVSDAEAFSKKNED